MLQRRSRPRPELADRSLVAADEPCRSWTKGCGRIAGFGSVVYLRRRERRRWHPAIASSSLAAEAGVAIAARPAVWVVHSGIALGTRHTHLVPVSDPSATGPFDRRSDRRATWGEICLILALTAGVWIIQPLVASRADADAVTFTDQHLLGVVFYEVLVAASLVPWLVMRGWSPRSVAGAPVPSDVAHGVAVCLLVMVSTWLVWVTLIAVNADAAHALANGAQFAGGASAAAIVLLSVLNPVFEEFLWLGYVVPSLTPKLGVLGACAVSVALRLSVHVYQGPSILVSILPGDIALTWYYARTRRLWPAVVAHVILDVVGLAGFLSAQ
jgi:uncharacterized protein